MPAAVVTLKLAGAEALQAELRRLAREVPEQLGAAVLEEAKGLEARAQELVPRDTGQLAASVAVTSEVSPDGVSVAVGYTDPKALEVHEGIHWHRRIQGTRGFKWLQRATDAFELGFVERLAARMRQLLGG